MNLFHYKLKFSRWEELCINVLPPLNSLKSFESAARHLSFTKAADELFVTQAAVSHQIKLLEDFLGVELFIRKIVRSN